jgi:ATP synthase protein I
MCPTNSMGPDDPWQEPEEAYRVYSKAEMGSLLQAGVISNTFLSPWKVVVSQALLTIVSMVICAFFLDGWRISIYTYSTFWGGLIGVLPSALFLLRLELAKRSSVPSPGKFLAALVSGEFIKLAVTIGLFIGIAFAYPEVKWVPLLITYLVTLKCVWLA